MIISISGSTNRTLQCAQALASDDRFEIGWVLTPPPKPIGRDKTLTPNPLYAWAEAKQVPIITVESKIDSTLNYPACDLLLVVDFGYLVPEWLLQRPNIAPLNIHPSALPLWRGSSPGQFVLLSGATNSAVTLMIMDVGLDSGPILKQYPFVVEPSWTQTEYYQHSFELICGHLADDLVAFSGGNITPQPQPASSPTQVAGRLSKDDSFVEWAVVKAAMQDKPVVDFGKTSPLLQTFAEQSGSWAVTLERAARAFLPWPGLWTLVPTAKGPQRMKILSSHLENKALVLDQVHLEGKNPARWPEVKAFVS